MAQTSSGLMAIQKISLHGTTYPFGDNRSVQQAFPSAIPAKQSDPFLMCDYFGADSEVDRKARHEDDFPIGWHPHRGMDIASYWRKGTGRHGDSLGNRGTFSTPGMQWISAGSGVQHAEGGANGKEDEYQGFQIWINVPSQHKMDDPDYGTVPNEQMPVQSIGTHSQCRILAGEAPGKSLMGPFRTKQPVQMIDFELHENDTVEFDVTDGLDTVILYVYEGSLSSANNNESTTNRNLGDGAVLLLDADDSERRRISLSTSSDQTAGVMLFAGKKLNEPIAWHGPFVMNTQEQICETISEMRKGTFPPKRVDWDYRTWRSRPKCFGCA